MNYSWTENEELLKACQRFQIPWEISPNAFSYTAFESLLQDGPQCGLVALGMYYKMTKNEIDGLYETAKSLNFTLNGEIFSAEDMYTLARKYSNKKVELYSGYFASKDITEFLLNKGVAVVPYDADANHSPCTKNGHKAHWALVSGIIVSENTTFIIARQGKSKYLGIWPIEQMALSNSQLNEFAPLRKHSSLTYKLPEGGISGPKGLKNKCVLIYK